MYYYTTYHGTYLLYYAVLPSVPVHNLIIHVFKMQPVSEVFTLHASGPLCSTVTFSLNTSLRLFTPPPLHHPMSMSAEDAKKAADDEKMRLLQKIKDNSNGPEQAKRAIVALDKMVNGLKKRRRLCGESIEEDTKRLFWLQHEIDEVEKQRKKLFDVLEDRRRRRDAAQKARDAIKAQLLEMSKFMDKTRSKVTHRTSKTFSKSTTAELSAARGYNCLPGSTFYPGGNKKKRSTLGKAGRASMSRR